MLVDLIQRCYFQQSKGNDAFVERLHDWIEEGRQLPGNLFEVNDQPFEWKILAADRMNDSIDEDYPKWLMTRAMDGSFEMLSQLWQPEFDNGGNLRSVELITLWLLHSDIPNLEAEDAPICISNPHHFKTPHHRLTYDLKVLVRKLYDPTVSITRYVDYKEFRTDRIVIR